MSSPYCFFIIYRVHFRLYPVAMSIFQKAKDMYSLQKQAKTLKKELKNVHIEADVDGIISVVTGEQEVVSITIKDESWNDLKGREFGKKKLEEAAVKSLNKGLKKAREIGAGKMKGIWGELGVGA